MLMVPLFLFLPKLALLSRAVGLTYMCGISVVLFALDQTWKIDLALSYTMACILLGLTFYMAFTAVVAAPPKPAPRIVETVSEPDTPPASKAGKGKKGKKHKKR